MCIGRAGTEIHYPKGTCLPTEVEPLKHKMFSLENGIHKTVVMGAKKIYQAFYLSSQMFAVVACNMLKSTKGSKSL